MFKSFIAKQGGKPTASFQGVAKAADPFRGVAGQAGTISGLGREFGIEVGTKMDFHLHFDAEMIEESEFDEAGFPTEIRFIPRGDCLINQCAKRFQDEPGMTITWRGGEGEGVSYSLTNKASWWMHGKRWSFYVEVENREEFINRMLHQVGSALTPEDYERFQSLRL